jgi:CBS domain-containing protein
VTAPLQIEKPQPEERLRSTAEAVKSGEQSPTLTVREFLGWFGAHRRGYIVVQSIRQALAEAGLETVPDFESEYIDSEISFAKASAAPNVPAQVGGTVVGVISPEPESHGVGLADPTHRVGKLQAANRVPVSIAPDQPLNTAISLMLAYDYSQLPVMSGERALKGMVTWRSIAARWALRPGPGASNQQEKVVDFMDDAPLISADSSLFSAIPTIISHGFILVRDGTNRVIGIVTASDLSEQFQQLAEPFLLIGEIEGHVRRLIARAFTAKELECVKAAEDAHPIESVADLTFGQYVRLLEDPQRWPKLALNIDRATFIEQLDQVRTIRNEVMHFDPDPLGELELEQLRRFARFLQTLHSLGL